MSQGKENFNPVVTATDNGSDNDDVGQVEISSKARISRKDLLRIGTALGFSALTSLPGALTAEAEVTQEDQETERRSRMIPNDKNEEVYALFDKASEHSEYYQDIVMRSTQEEGRYGRQKLTTSDLYHMINNLDVFRRTGLNWFVYDSSVGSGLLAASIIETAYRRIKKLPTNEKKLAWINAINLVGGGLGLGIALKDKPLEMIQYVSDEAAYSFLDAVLSDEEIEHMTRSPLRLSNFQEQREARGIVNNIEFIQVLQKEAVRDIFLQPMMVVDPNQTPILDEEGKLYNLSGWGKDSKTVFFPRQIDIVAVRDSSNGGDSFGNYRIKGKTIVEKGGKVRVEDAQLLIGSEDLQGFTSLLEGLAIPEPALPGIDPASEIKRVVDVLQREQFLQSDLFVKGVVPLKQNEDKDEELLKIGESMMTADLVYAVNPRTLSSIKVFPGKDDLCEVWLVFEGTDIDTGHNIRFAVNSERIGYQIFETPEENVRIYDPRRASEVYESLCAGTLVTVAIFGLAYLTGFLNRILKGKKEEDL